MAAGPRLTGALEHDAFYLNHPPLPFSPCGRRWREAPDEGYAKQANCLIQDHISQFALCIMRFALPLIRPKKGTFSRKGRRKKPLNLNTSCPKTRGRGGYPARTAAT